MLYLSPQNADLTREQFIEEYLQAVDYLIALCKGRVDSWTGRFFYGRFLSAPLFNRPTSIEEARERIEGAWWVEEEDLVQEILAAIWEKKLTSGRELLHILQQHMSHYLERQKIFQRQSDWQDAYTYYLESPSGLPREHPSILMVFNPESDVLKTFSLFDRYLLYLSKIHNLPRKKTCRCILQHTRQYNRFKDRLDKKIKHLEELNDRQDTE